MKGKISYIQDSNGIKLPVTVLEALRFKGYNLSEFIFPTYNKLFACMGDSITSTQVTNMGKLIHDRLYVEYLKESDDIMFGNLACGYATMCDVWQDGVNTTTIMLTKSENVHTSTNVLSNQVYRLLAHTTMLNSQISYVDNEGTTHSIDTSIGVGKGYTSDIPDIIYIAGGINDGNWGNTIVDDCSDVFSQVYANLKRDTIASALRWIIETLQINYPLAQIFVATPLQSNINGGWDVTKLKRDIIIKVCNQMGVHIVDSWGECGLNRYNVSKFSGDGVHPSINPSPIARYVASNIIQNMIINVDK